MSATSPEPDGESRGRAGSVGPDRTDQITMRVRRFVSACFKPPGKGCQRAGAFLLAWANSLRRPTGGSVEPLGARQPESNRLHALVQPKAVTAGKDHEDPVQLET